MLNTIRDEYNQQGKEVIIYAVGDYENDPQSLGYSYLYCVEGMYKSGEVKVLSVDGIAPTEENRQKIADQLGYPVDVMIPNEYKMISVANSGRLAQGLPEDTLLMKSIGEMADRIIAAGR